MPSEEVSIYIRLRDMALRKMSKLARAVGLTSQSFRRLRSIASAALNRVRGVLDRVAKSIARWGKYVAIAAAAFATYFGQKMVRTIIAVGSKYEMLYNQILTAMRGIRSATDQTWQKILDFAARSPLMTDQVVAAFATLKAAGVNAAFEVTKSLGSLALMFGKRIDELAGVFLGAETEVFRRMGILIDRTGKKAVIQTAAWKVEVEKDQRSIWAGLAEVIKKSFGEAMPLAQRTWEGAINTMLGKWDVFLDKISKAGFLDWLTAALTTANEYIDQLDKEGKLDKMAKQLSDRLIAAFGWLVGIGEQIRHVVLNFKVLHLSVLRVLKSLGQIEGWVARFLTLPGRAFFKIMGMILRKAKDLGDVVKNAFMDMGAVAEAVMLRSFEPIWERMAEGWESKKGLPKGFEGLKEDLEGIAEYERVLKDLQTGAYFEEDIARLTSEILTDLVQMGMHSDRVKSIQEAIEQTLRRQLGEKEKARELDAEKARIVAAEKAASQRLEDIEKRRSEYLKEQERIKKSLVTLGNEEAAKIEWVARNLDKMTGKYLAQNEEVRGIVSGHEGLRTVLEEQLRTAKEIIEGEGRRLIAAEARRRGIELPEQAERRFEAEKEITRRGLARTIAGEREQPISLEADIELVNNPQVQVAIDASTDVITSKIYAIMAEQLNKVELQLEEKFASREVLWRREKRVAAAQISGQSS